MSNTKTENWNGTTHEPFSPLIIETSVPEKFVNIINTAEIRFEGK